eukprot:scaffold17189_cov67-Cyclotella_meneghiniana.AAC.5
MMSQLILLTNDSRQSILKPSDIDEEKESDKHGIRVGQEFQVLNLPAAKWSEHSVSNDELYGEKVWDAELAKQSIDSNILERIVPHDRKEAALVLFHKNNYKLNGILPQIMEQRAKHGMDWSVRTKEAFQKSIIKSRKNFASVAREVNRPISECQDYYYGTFKLMSEYSKLKEALKQDVQNETTIQQLNWCVQCNECGKEMISCAICEMYFHFTCCKYPPKGADVWFCNDCDPQD